MVGNGLKEKIKELFEEEKNYDEVIQILTDDNLKEYLDEELYIWRGNAWYELKNYENAMSDYNNAIEANKKSEMGYYNRGLVKVVCKQYESAIEDCNNVLSFNPNSDAAYLYRGSIYRLLGKYETAIKDYDKAIELNPNYPNNYYNRGIAYYDKGLVNENIEALISSKESFEKYLELTLDEKDHWSVFATDYINEIDNITQNPRLLIYIQIINRIRKKLLVHEKLVTHYTSLSTLKSIIIDGSKFRISEGNFLNDPSEGEKLYAYLGNDSLLNSQLQKIAFYPKPFIGSFVIDNKSDDLNMWRFYGKENTDEAKGCSISLNTQDFVDKIHIVFSNELKERRLENESDTNFYWVVYIDENTNKIEIPNSEDLVDELEVLLDKLKTKLNSVEFNEKEQYVLKKYLNNIAFLFKNDSFKNENEVRLVVKGFGYPKKINENIWPPKVYIELESIKDIVKKIILGPKVENETEWNAALFYSYLENAPLISKSPIMFK